MGEQKNAFFGTDGFFLADWLPLEAETVAKVNTKYAEAEISGDLQKIYENAEKIKFSF